jgi:hypothetical protein
MDFLAPETSHIMALKIKDYIISSLLLAHHYLRLIVDDHSYSEGALAWEGATTQRAPEPASWYIMQLIVADHDCIYWLYLYGPDLLYPYLLLYTHCILLRGKLPFSGQCERLSRRLVDK